MQESNIANERRPWRQTWRLPPSSVTWSDELPHEDSPPWVCLSQPGAPVVIRSYDYKSRTCDIIAPHGRWLLESALVPRGSASPDEIHFGWHVAVGDVEPGWTIVYMGNDLWFPQRVLRVDDVSEDWQRVWSLGDISTRNIWTSDRNELRDNGFASGWSFDDSPIPRWVNGPWYPLQSEPLAENPRRFVLDKFGIAGECPQCGDFGKPLSLGYAPGMLTNAHVIAGGCELPIGETPNYACECGYRWGIDDHGRILDPDSFLDMQFAHEENPGDEHEGELNYDYFDRHPYGEQVEREFLDILSSFLWAAAEAIGVPEDQDGAPDYPPELLEYFFGRDDDE